MVRIGWVLLNNRERDGGRLTIFQHTNLQKDVPECGAHLCAVLKESVRLAVYKTAVFIRSVFWYGAGAMQ